MGRESHDKRQREKKRQERAAEKRERRELRAEESPDAEAPDADALMEEFRVLNEQRAAGVVDAETFDKQRRVIFEQLGLGDPFNE